MRPLFLALTAGVASAYPGSAHPRRDLTKSSHYATTERDPPLPTLAVWPMPQGASYPTAQGSACLSPVFSIACAGAVCPDPLADAFDRYAGYLSFAGPPSPAGSSTWVTALNVTVSAAAPLALRVSENYTLTMPSGVGGDTVAVLSADTQWGALRGLETFSQLFVWAGRGVPVAYCTTSAGLRVDDFPR